MRNPLPACLLLAALASLSACTSTGFRSGPPAESAIVLSPEYIAALDKVLRVPEKNLLLDEGRVPVAALQIVATYQDVCRRNRFRELLSLFDPELRKVKGNAVIENDLIRRETVSEPSIAVLTDVTWTPQAKSKDGSSGIYEFTFAHPHRGGNSTSRILVDVPAKGKAYLGYPL